MDSNPICQPSPANKMKCSFLDYIQLLMISRAGQWTQTPSTTPLQPKNEMLIFWLCSTSDDWPGWSMDSNPIHHPSAANKMKCFFLDYVQLLMISQAGWWLKPPSATPLQPKNEMLNFNYVQLLMISQAGQWTQTPSATPLQPKNEMLLFGLCSLLMISQAGRWTQTPSITPLQPIKWNTHFWITFNFWWSAGLVDGLKPHSPPLSSQKNEMLIFWLCSTSDDQLGWSMDSNPICHPSPANKMKCFFLDCVQLLMISQAGWWTRTPFATPLQPKNEMPLFGLRSTSDDWLG